MTHVEDQHEAPAGTAFMFANPNGGWDCYGLDEELPPEAVQRLGPPEETPSGPA